MNATARRARATAHTKHDHKCVCGKVVWGNGGWASHRWSCPKFQAWAEEYVVEHGIIPTFLANVRRHPKWWHDGKRWCRVCDLNIEACHHGWTLASFTLPDTVPIIDSGSPEGGLDWATTAAHYDERAIAQATRIDDSRYAVPTARGDDFIGWDFRRVDGRMRLAGFNIVRVVGTRRSDW